MIVGASTDTLDLQQKFTDKEKLNFPLYADTSKTAAKEYGVLAPSGYAQRVTFVIDKKGTIRKVYGQASAQKNPADVLKYVKEHLAKE